MPRSRYIQQALGDVHEKIKQARVLMVGAGGIGCELLKNLVLTGFGEIHLVDLDTIDLSNLNRQFLFRHEHIKRSKALVATETASKFNPDVRIQAHHANIKDPNFNVDFFASFDVIFNALDNLDARRHVNRMCLAADVPLIESGTTGFNGQVQVIKRGLTECYDCNPKETPKTFPVCTIRSTPSQPIHCIVWAKSYLFAEIFGTSEDESPDLDNTEDGENAEEIKNLRQESQALKKIRETMGSADFARQVFDKVFKDDIERLRSMEDMWRTRRKPTALDFETLSREAGAVDADISNKDQSAWTPAENLAVFSQSLARLSDQLAAIRRKPEGGDATAVLTFDKDNKDALDFVASSANLRSTIFGIEPKSEFDIKQMAGNIIPAIATANAMTAALCVLQSFHIFRGNYNKARMLFLARSVERAISSESLRPPNPHCSVCSVAHLNVQVNFAKATLRDLVEGVLKTKLAYRDELSVNIDGVGLVFDPDLEDNLDRSLQDLGVRQDGFLTVVDEEDDEPHVNLILYVKQTPQADGEGESGPSIRLMEEIEIKKRPEKPVEAPESPPVQVHGRSNNSLPDKAEQMQDLETGMKRKREVVDVDAGEPGGVRKRERVLEERPASIMKAGHNGLNGVGSTDGNGVMAVDLDDGGDGAIVIDDD